MSDLRLKYLINKNQRISVKTTSEMKNLNNTTVKTHDS